MLSVVKNILQPNAGLYHEMRVWRQAVVGPY